MRKLRCLKERPTSSGLSKQLILDGDIPNGDIILRNEPAQAAGAITDLKGGSIGLIGLRAGRIILVVEVASDRSALRGRNPNYYMLT
jgi:hypothetical protein